jgi:O-antigen/teichoic acid export membrane protein
MGGLRSRQERVSFLPRITDQVRSIASGKFVKGSMVYLTGNVVNAVLPFMLLPILTRYLTPTDYGLVATSVVLVQVTVTAIGLNTSGLIVQSQFTDDFETRRNLLSTNVLVTSGLAVVFILFTMSGGRLVERLTGFPGAWAPLLIVVALGIVVQQFYLAILQSRDEAKLFVGIQILGNVLNLSVAVLLVVGLGMDWRGRIIATVVGAAAVAAISLHGLRYRLGLLGAIFDRKALKGILHFGVPLIPHTAGGFAMVMAPRLYLNNLATVADTGLFGVAYNLASPIAVVVGAANQAYMPALFSKLVGLETAARLRLSRMLLLGAVTMPCLAVIYAVGTRWILPWIVGPRFLQVSDYVVWLALAFAMQGMYFVFANLVVFSKKTSLMAWRCDFAGGIAVLVGCPVLIGMNGPIGAAQATLLGFTISCVGAFIASRKAFPLPWADALRSLLRPGASASDTRHGSGE